MTVEQKMETSEVVDFKTLVDIIGSFRSVRKAIVHKTIWETIKPYYNPMIHYNPHFYEIKEYQIELESEVEDDTPDDCEWCYIDTYVLKYVGIKYLCMNKLVPKEARKFVKKDANIDDMWDKFRTLYQT